MRHLGRLLVVAVVLGALAVTATPSGAATGITPGTFAVGQYVPSGCSTIRGVALATVPPACPVGTLRANNPGAILLGYLKGGTCGRSDCPTDPHSAEYAHAPNGSRIVGFGGSTFLMQFDNPTWRAHVLAQCQALVQAHWDGCFLDVLGRGSYDLGYPNGIEIPGSNPPATYAGNQWSALAAALYASIQQGMPAGTHLAANGLVMPQCAATPGCPAKNGSAYNTSGLIHDNTTSDFAAEMEVFPCFPESASACFTTAEVTEWLSAATVYPAGAEHLLIVDHQGKVLPHDTSLAMFLLADGTPAHTYWVFCTSQSDPACLQPDPEYVAFYNRVLGPSGSTYQSFGSGGGSVFHTSWSNGDCYVNAGASSRSVVIPGPAGQAATELNGRQDQAGKSATLAAHSGQCWRR